MRCVLFSAVWLLSTIAYGEELSDYDVESIVQLADGVYRGDVVSITEIEHCTASDDCRNYRNAKVMVRSNDSEYQTFRASKIDGDWRLDSTESKRLEYSRNLRERLLQ